MRFKPLIAIALLLSLSVVAYAHPGRTDSDGGHINHSTGEYHYHHGYPEHQHYDIDGDGDLDCPYKTAIITKPKDETTSSTETQPHTIEATYSEQQLDTQKEKPKPTQKRISFEGVMLIAFGAVVVVGLVVGWISKAIKNKTKKK